MRWSSGHASRWLAWQMSEMPAPVPMRGMLSLLVLQRPRCARVFWPVVCVALLHGAFERPESWLSRNLAARFDCRAHWRVDSWLCCGGDNRVVVGSGAAATTVALSLGVGMAVKVVVTVAIGAMVTGGAISAGPTVRDAIRPPAKIAPAPESGPQQQVVTQTAVGSATVVPPAKNVVGGANKAVSRSTGVPVAAGGVVVVDVATPRSRSTSVRVAGAEDSVPAVAPAGDQPADGSVPTAPPEVQQPESKQPSGKPSQSKQRESQQPQQSELSNSTITTPPVICTPPVVAVVVAPTKHDVGGKNRSDLHDPQRD